MRSKLIEPVYVTRPFLPPIKDFEVFLELIWDSRSLTNGGRFHQELEEALCKYLGISYISLFANGTLALITALQALRITGEVITTPFSFVATTHSLKWNNIEPVFVDIEPQTFNINPDKIEAAITPKTTAIMPVHVYGNPCDVKRIKQIADLYGLKIIYDACHTFGVKINGKSILNFGDLSVMSFHATKVYTTFEGGAIVCHDAATKKRIDQLKNFGFVSETSVVLPGINAKMNELQAAMGLLQLKYIDEAVRKRKRVAIQYRKTLKNISGITCLFDKDGVTHCYSYFPVLIDRDKYGKSRDEVYEEFKQYNIFTRRYFYPLISQFPSYNWLPSASKENLAIAEKVASEVLCLPMFPDLESDVLDKICELIRTKFEF